MREMFEWIDNYPLTPWHLLWFIIPFAGLWLWQRWLDRREAMQIVREKAKRDFYESRARAQECFEKLGPRHPQTQSEVTDALLSWEVWQGKTFSDLREETATPIEWEALSLWKSTDVGQPTA